MCRESSFSWEQQLPSWLILFYINFKGRLQIWQGIYFCFSLPKISISYTKWNEIWSFPPTNLHLYIFWNFYCINVVYIIFIKKVFHGFHLWLRVFKRQPHLMWIHVLISQYLQTWLSYLLFFNTCDSVAGWPGILCVTHLGDFALKINSVTFTYPD